MSTFKPRSDFTSTFVLDADRMHLLTAALSSYWLQLHARADEARENDGRPKYQTNMGLPEAGVDSDRMEAMAQEVEALGEALLDCIPDDVAISPVFEDGSAIYPGHDAGVPIVGDWALALNRQLNELDNVQARQAHPVSM